MFNNRLAKDLVKDFDPLDSKTIRERVDGCEEEMKELLVRVSDLNTTAIVGRTLLYEREYQLKINKED